MRMKIKVCFILFVFLTFISTNVIFAENVINEVNTSNTNEVITSNTIDEYLRILAEYTERNSLNTNETMNATATNYSADLSISEDKSSMKTGETVTYEISVSNISAGNGIVMFKTNIEWDSDDFVCTVKGDDDGNWTVVNNGIVGNTLTLNKSNLEPTTADQTIAKVSFTAKSNITAKTYSILFSKIEIVTDDLSIISEDNLTKSITITQSGNNNNTNNTNANNQNTNTNNSANVNNQGSTNTNTNTSIPAKTDNSLSSKVLPYTGIIEGVLITSSIIALILTIVFHKKYKKWEKI